MPPWAQRALCSRPAPRNRGRPAAARAEVAGAPADLDEAVTAAETAVEEAVTSSLGRRARQAHRAAQLADPHPPAGCRDELRPVQRSGHRGLRIRELLEKTLAKHTGQPVDRVREDIERNKFFTAEEAKGVGARSCVVITVRTPASRSITGRLTTSDLRQLALTVPSASRS
jgi:hypothetical protein